MLDVTNYRDFFDQVTPEVTGIRKKVDRACRKSKVIKAIYLPVHFLCLTLALYSVFVSDFALESPDPTKLLPYLKLFEGLDYPLFQLILGVSAAVVLLVPLAAVLVLKLLLVPVKGRGPEPLSYGDGVLPDLEALKRYAEVSMAREEEAASGGKGAAGTILLLLNGLFTVAIVIYFTIHELKNQNLIMAVLISIFSGGIVGLLALLATGLLSLPAMLLSGCPSGKRRDLEALIARTREMQKLAAEEQKQEKARLKKEAKRLRAEQEAQREAQLQQTLERAQKLCQQGAYDEALKLYRSLKQKDPQVRIPMLCCLRKSSETELKDYREIFRELQSVMKQAPTEQLRLQAKSEIDAMLQKLRTEAEDDLELAGRYEEEFAYDKQLQILQKWANMGLPEGIALYVSFQLTKNEGGARYPDLIGRLEEALGLGFADHSVEEMCQNLAGKLSWEYGRRLLSTDEKNGREYIGKAANWGNPDAHRYLNPPVVYAYVPQSYEPPKPELRKTVFSHWVTGEDIYTDDNGNYFDEKGNPVERKYVD